MEGRPAVVHALAKITAALALTQVLLHSSLLPFRARICDVVSLAVQKMRL